jgi:hypothetical protein
MANDFSGKTPTKNDDPDAITADDVRTPDAGGVSGDHVGTAEKGEPTPGLSTDAEAPATAEVPMADPVPGTSKPGQEGKYVSGNMHGQDEFLMQGMVDHTNLDSSGQPYNAHAPGLIRVPNPMVKNPIEAVEAEKEEKGTAPNAANPLSRTAAPVTPAKATETKAAKADDGDKAAKSHAKDAKSHKK